MTSRFHIAVIAIIATAGLAVGIAGAATLPEASTLPAKKSDRLPTTVVSADYVTVEMRSDNTSVLVRRPAG